MKFNLFKKKTTTVTNAAGAKAYALTPETELYAAVVTASLSDTFYEAADKRLARVQQLVSKTDPAYVAQLAVYARDTMHMRSIPMVLAVELARTNSGNTIVGKAVAGVVKRADEITELLACYQMANSRTGTKKLARLSKQVQKGLSVSFNRFDEYQFAKYSRDAEIKLRDALFLVHPKAKDDAQQTLFNKIADGTLAIPYTWETELSALGQRSFAGKEEKSAAVKAKWEELIDSGRLGYMAMLRNLRNILAAKVGAAYVQKVCNQLADEDAVARAKQFPFRFLAAYRELKGFGEADTFMVQAALEKAIVASTRNFRGFDSNVNVLIACDVSGSMQKPISPRSTVNLYDIGLVLGMLLQAKCRRVVTGMFGDTWKPINMEGGNVLANVAEYYRREGEVGYATNGHKVIDYLISKRIAMDKVMLFTDCQLWDTRYSNNSLATSWRQYKLICPGARLYLFDLAGYGNTPLSVLRDDVYLIAGWSDKVFDVLQAIEEGSDAVAQIKQIVL